MEANNLVCPYSTRLEAKVKSYHNLNYWFGKEVAERLNKVGVKVLYLPHIRPNLQLKKLGP